MIGWPQVIHHDVSGLSEEGKPFDLVVCGWFLFVFMLNYLLFGFICAIYLHELSQGRVCAHGGLNGPSDLQR